MVYQRISEREKPKVRGRPFPKGNKRGKLEYHVLDDSGHRSGDSGGVVDPHTLNGHSGPLKTEIEVLQIDEASMNQEQEENQPDEGLIECLEFFNGNNKLKVTFSKKNNRNFRVKIMLNDEIEIKPISFVTKSSAHDSWDMLKRMLKK